MPWPRITATPADEHIERLMALALGRRVLRSHNLSEGAFGVTYTAELDGPPRRVVVKWQKRLGQAVREARQLEELRRHALVKVPEVYCCHTGSAEVPFEALIMEYIDGKTVLEVPDPPPDLAMRFTQEAIDVLLHWHGVRQPKGYGPLDGPYHARWVDYHRQRLCTYWEEARSVPPDQNPLPAEMLQVAERSLEAIEPIIGGRKDGAVLLHSDYWLGNIMVDPQTYHIAGIIDPLDAEWGDRELDLILLQCHLRRQLDLRAEYCRRVPPDERFELRQAFYRLWYEIQNYARIRWRCQDWINTWITQRLRNQMDKWL